MTQSLLPKSDYKSRELLRHQNCVLDTILDTVVSSVTHSGVQIAFWGCLTTMSVTAGIFLYGTVHSTDSLRQSDHPLVWARHPMSFGTE